jgi:anti-sigma regulatory factor (Ser/Thr protein kinase)
VTSVSDRSREGVREREVVLAATPLAGREARTWLTGLVAAEVSPRLLEDARLVLSELVGNSVRHTSSEVVVCRLRLTAARLRVEVWDTGDGLLARTPAESRGLTLVRLLSSRVSSGHRPGWSWVAAEFDLAAARP